MFQQHSRNQVPTQVASPGALETQDKADTAFSSSQRTSRADFWAPSSPSLRIYNQLPPTSPRQSVPLLVVIDASIVVRTILEICLSREGYTVVAFPDGIEAMRWFSHDSRI